MGSGTCPVALSVAPGDAEVPVLYFVPTYREGSFAVGDEDASLVPWLSELCDHIGVLQAEPESRQGRTQLV